MAKSNKSTKKVSKNFTIKNNKNSKSTINEADSSATTPETNEKAKALVNDRFKLAKSFRETDQEAIWKRSYNNWRGVLDQGLYPWRSKLFIPWSFTVVETIIPKVFARDPKWRALSRSPDFPEDGPSTVQDLLNYQWNHIGMRGKMYDFIKDSLMYSKGFAKVTWNYKTKTKTIMEPIVGEDDKITFERTQKTEVEHDDPNVEIVDPFDIYVDPDATTLQDAVYVIHRKTVPLKTLKDNPNYNNVAQLSQSKIKGVQNSNYVQDYLQDETRFKNTTSRGDNYKELVEVLEYWERDRLVVVANRTVVLRDSPNPYSHKQLPFVDLDDYRDPHKFYGQSELSVIDPLQREINSIRNQRRDYDNLALNPVIRMIPGVLRNPNSAVMAPGNVWMVSDLNSMDVFELPKLQGVSSDIEDRTAQDIKMSVAIDEIGIGLLPEAGNRRSATEVVTAQSMAGKRFAIKIALLEEAVKQIGQLVFALNQQFLDQERIIQIVGEEGATEWVKLDPEDIRGEYFIDIETGSMLPKDEIAQRQEAMQLLQYVTPIISPVINSNPKVIMPIIRMIIDTFDLPGKQSIIEELQEALGIAKEVADEKMQAETANAQAGALGTLAQAAQPQEESLNPETLPPETAQGARADQELALLLGNQ